MQNIRHHKEQWKDIPGYEGSYQASSRGRIRSLDRTISQTKGTTTYGRLMRGKVIKPRLQNNGYLIVKLSMNGIMKPLTVHRLVLTAFTPVTDESLIVNHKDGNKQNNDLTNLEWVTHSENNIHAVTHKLVAKTSNKAVVCTTTGMEYPSITAAAKAIGVTRGAIAQAIRKNQKSQGLQWKKK